MATAQVLHPTGPPGQPDIGYAPDFSKYQARSQKRAATEKLDQSLPEGFPSRLESDLVWDGTNIASRFDWVYELNDQEVEEIEEALKHFKCMLNYRLVVLGSVSADVKNSVEQRVGLY